MNGVTKPTMRLMGWVNQHPSWYLHILERGPLVEILELSIKATLSLGMLSPLIPSFSGICKKIQIEM
jgi:hypothetical protein